MPRDAILGWRALLQEDLPPDGPPEDMVARLQDAVERGSGVVSTRIVQCRLDLESIWRALHIFHVFHATSCLCGHAAARSPVSVSVCAHSGTSALLWQGDDER